jgi:hypothetical protein
MIDDLSLTLKAILQDPSLAIPFPELAAADIVFDRPLDPFTPPKTTVDLFLYDLRENLELRSNEQEVQFVNGQAITIPAPLRLNCSYLVTAWPVGGTELALQEQLLLAQVLQVLSAFPMIPSNYLQGAMIGQDPPLPMVALHPDALKNLAEFWSSLGSKMKASLTVTVTISMPVYPNLSDFIVTTHSTSYAPGATAPPDSLVHIAGQVLDNLGDGVAGALVDILDAGLRQTTNAEGQFDFLAVAPGAHTIRAVAPGFKSQTQPLTVPGSPEDYVITLTPL